MVEITNKKIVRNTSTEVIPSCNGENTTPIAPKPKFKIHLWFNRFNSEQKNLTKQAYFAHFNLGEQNFYKVLKRDSLSDEELHFFAGIFDCKIQDLYTEPLKHVPSIYELQRTAHGSSLGKQVSLDGII